MGITSSSGKISVRSIAGSPNSGFADGPGQTARFAQPNTVVFDDRDPAAPALLVSDCMNHRIRRIDLTSNTYPVTTYVGSGARVVARRRSSAALPSPLSGAAEAGGGGVIPTIPGDAGVVLPPDASTAPIVVGGAGTPTNAVRALSNPLGLGPAATPQLPRRPSQQQHPLQQQQHKTAENDSGSGSGSGSANGEGGAGAAPPLLSGASEERDLSYPRGFVIDRTDNSLVLIDPYAVLRIRGGVVSVIAPFGGECVAVSSAGVIFACVTAQAYIARIDPVTRVVTRIAGTGQSENVDHSDDARLAGLAQPSAIDFDALAPDRVLYVCCRGALRKLELPVDTAVLTEALSEAAHSLSAQPSAAATNGDGSGGGGGSGGATPRATPLLPDELCALVAGYAQGHGRVTTMRVVSADERDRGAALHLDPYATVVTSGGVLVVGSGTGHLHALWAVERTAGADGVHRARCLFSAADEHRFGADAFHNPYGMALDNARRCVYVVSFHAVRRIKLPKRLFKPKAA